MRNLRFKLEKAGNAILALEKARGIIRFFVESEIQYVKKVARFAFVKSGRATIPSLRQKAIREGLSLISDTEKLRFLLEIEIQDVLGRERLRDNVKTDPLFVPFPALAWPGEYGKCWRVDIKSCFYSIYSRVGVDARCLAVYDKENNLIDVKAIAKGKLNKENSSLIQMLAPYKMLRNAIVGLTSSCFVNVYKAGKFHRQFYRSKLLNLELRSFILVVLHYLVSQIPVSSLVYWNIDGGFVYEEGIDAFIHACEQLGFEYRVDEIDSLEITCLGGYRYYSSAFGEIRSGHYGKSSKKGVCHLWRIKNEEVVKKWLRKLLGM